MRTIIQEALRDLEECCKDPDTEAAHVKADAVLIWLLEKYGCPREVIDAYNQIGKWYA